MKCHGYWSLIDCNPMKLSGPLLNPSRLGLWSQLTGPVLVNSHNPLFIVVAVLLLIII